MIYKNALSILMLCLFFSSISYCQQLSTIKIKVIDKRNQKPLVGAHVCIGKKCSVSNDAGYFNMNVEIKEKQKLIVTYVGYKTYIKEISSLFIPKEIQLEPKSSELEEVIIKGINKKQVVKKSALTKVTIDKDFLSKNRENSLMETLKVLPGVSTISIGSGQSKPVIRGLGFNRVVVAENGIKHEAQQWGADHGLEIDQYNAEEIEITKGASSLLYGSEAIAGVVSIKTNTLPKTNTFLKELTLFTESNKDLLGVSFGIKQRFVHWYYKVRSTYQDYGDYILPTDRIVYGNRDLRLYKNHLRNTAGFNQNLSVSFGYVNDTFSNETTISNVNAKNGFFANVHGLEARKSYIDYDSSSRDVDLPFHEVNHFKVINNSKINFSNSTFSVGLGFQNNQREENSEPVEHGYMPKPSSFKERIFNKNTYSLNLKNQYYSLDKHKPIIGVNLEFQDNKIDGWGFLIPAYERFMVGLYFYNQYKITPKTYIEGGFRYDYGVLNTKPYYDWFFTPVKDTNGKIISKRKLQRAKKEELAFGSYSASLGVSHTREKTSYKLNIGKSFRIPLAHELASNGVNYHMYRYEEGTLDLDPESSYQIDGEFNLNTKLFNFSLQPFVNYFSNYIYLNPTSEYYQTLQKYKYTQSEVFRYGGELIAGFKPFKNLLISTSVEYVNSRQLSGSKKNFTLPFSPPLSSVISARYTFNSDGFLKTTNVFSNLRITAKQDEIVPPENPTEGYSLLSIGATTKMSLFSKKHLLTLQFKLNNVFNDKVFNHTSFYRLVEVPEPGRNFSINLTQTF